MTTTPNPLLGREAANDLRDAPRLSLYLSASLFCDGTSSPVKIRNISPTGALVDSAPSAAEGSLVQLVRGSLIVHALVVWSENGRCGLSFSGCIEVEQWRAAPFNAEQQRVDDIVRIVKEGSVPLPATASEDVFPRSASKDGLPADLRRVAELLAKLGDRLARDEIVVSLYGAELQNLDIAAQVVNAVETILTGHGNLASDAAKMISLRKSADQALGRRDSRAPYLK